MIDGIKHERFRVRDLREFRSIIEQVAEQGYGIAIEDGAAVVAAAFAGITVGANAAERAAAHRLKDAVLEFHRAAVDVQSLAAGRMEGE